MATPVNIQMAIPTIDAKRVDNVDSMQGMGDAWRGARGHEEFGTTITKWVNDVILTGQWPRTEMTGGVAIDVTSIVSAEVQRMKKLKERTNGDDQHYDDMMDTMRQAIEHVPKNENTQMPPASTTSTNINITQRSDHDNDDFLANIGLGNGGGDDGDGGDNGGDQTNATNDSGMADAQTPESMIMGNGRLSQMYPFMLQTISAISSSSLMLLAVPR